MMMDEKILILEDSPERTLIFCKVLSGLGVTHFIWDDAYKMIQEITEHLSNTALISLDYDLLPSAATSGDPGNGMEICKYLATQTPSCPVILHTANEPAAWEMLFALRQSRWNVDWLRHEQVGEYWIGRQWLPKVRQHIENRTHP